MNRFHHLILALTLACGPAAAQTKTTVFASGLKSPSKIILTPGGNLMVTEVEGTPNSGRVSLLDSNGTRRTLIDGLPSGLSAPENAPDGENGLAISGRVLYIAIGEGDGFRSGTAPGALVPNPAGPSSPIFATILQVTFNNDIDKLATSFSLKPADHYTLADNNPVTVSNSNGDQATFRLLTQFRTARPDPNTVYRNTHLYGLVQLPSQPNTIYVADAGNNAVWQVDTTTGRIQLVTRFAPTPNPIAGPPVIEAVPTSIRAYGNQLLVSLLSGAPFVPGVSRVMSVDPSTGKSDLFLSLLSSTIDTLYRIKADGSNQWFALQFSKNLGSNAPGSLIVYDSWQGQVLIDNLITPSSMALDSATGKLYITDLGEGTVLVADVGR